MTRGEALQNIKRGKCIPYKRETLATMEELIKECENLYRRGHRDGMMAQAFHEELCREERISILQEMRKEISEYGSIWVTYTITDKTKTDKGIEKLVSDVLMQAKEQVINVIDKYMAESEE